ncbi:MULTISPECIES: hypothetical protein [Pseudomonas]|uniref:hypothetical protein n=1 Tax=Pseudomonas TaxID=286 RepID=UPI00135C253A|nr:MULTISPECIES: hypothetical protein [Pseudomonas]MCK8682746.1 hypothetical protein [Pseudomonas umsongensis]
MNFRCQLIVLLVTTSTLGCTTSNPVVTLPLAATTRNAGQIANTTLVSQGTQTGFTFFIGGVPDGASLPLRLYTFIYSGSCQQPGPVAYAMNDRIDTERMARARAWTYSRNAPITMPDLLSGKYSIVVRTTPADGNADIFCGDIKQASM